MRIQLSDHFYLDEYLCTTVRPYPMILDQVVFMNLVKLNQYIMQPLRVWMQCPIVITSGWRTKEQNDLIPGHAVNSNHLRGLACDFHCVDMLTAYEFLSVHPNVGELIWNEKKNYIHVSLKL